MNFNMNFIKLLLYMKNKESNSINNKIANVINFKLLN